jgi:hypothetical protein
VRRPKWSTWWDARVTRVSGTSAEGSELSEESSGSEPEDGQPAQEAWVARSNWVSEALGRGWVEVEPGIFLQPALDDPAPPNRPTANAETQSLEQILREALPSDPPEADTASDGDPVRSSRPGD